MLNTILLVSLIWLVIIDLLTTFIGLRFGASEGGKVVKFIVKLLRIKLVMKNILIVRIIASIAFLLPCLFFPLYDTYILIGAFIGWFLVNVNNVKVLYKLGGK